MSEDEVVFEQINYDICVGKYEDMEVTHLETNGYINITQLCRKYPVLIQKWEPYNYRNKLDSLTREGYDPILIFENVSGTYIHPRLALEVISQMPIENRIKMLTIMKQQIVFRNTFTYSFKKKVRVDLSGISRDSMAIENALKSIKG